MNATGGSVRTHSGQAFIVCPSCGEVYDTPDRVTDILRNSGFCTNLTCLEDLSRLPFEEALLQAKEDRADRRAC